MIRAPGVNALLNSAAVLRQLVSRRNAFEEAVADRRSKARPDKKQRTVWTFGFKGWKIGKGFATFGQKLLSHLFTKKPEVSTSLSKGIFGWQFLSLWGDLPTTFWICESCPRRCFGYWPVAVHTNLCPKHWWGTIARRPNAVCRCKGKRSSVSKEKSIGKVCLDRRNMTEWWNPW